MRGTPGRAECRDAGGGEVLTHKVHMKYADLDPSPTTRGNGTRLRIPERLHPRLVPNNRAG